MSITGFIEISDQNKEIVMEDRNHPGRKNNITQEHEYGKDDDYTCSWNEWLDDCYEAMLLRGQIKDE